MRIVLTTEPASSTLEEPDDFTAFSVAAPTGTADALDRALGPVGTYDGEHVWVERDALVDLAGESGADSAWRDGLAAMIDYARAKGFLSEDGTAIRAHVEWQ